MQSPEVLKYQKKVDPLPVHCYRCGRHKSELPNGVNGMPIFSHDMKQRFCKDRAECRAYVLRQNPVALKLVVGGRR